MSSRSRSVILGAALASSVGLDAALPARPVTLTKATAQGVVEAIHALGRYVDPVRLPDGRYLLDFNAAYNPACAFSTHYNCPIPPKSNTLAVAIRAGEMDSDYH